MNNKPLRVSTFIDKGGTGKTTVAANLGVAVSEKGRDVLLIDLAGKQGDLSKHFGIWDEVKNAIERDDDWPNISTVFQEEWDIIVDKLGDDAVEDLIYTTTEGPDIIPAHPGLDGLDADLGNISDPRDRYSRLDEFLNEYIDHMHYDLVLIDLPGITNNVTYNGLWAAQNVIAPVEMGVFESSQVQSLVEDLDKMMENFDVEVELAMVLPNKIDRRTKLSREYLDEYREKYPEKLAPSPLPKSQDIRNAADKGTSVFSIEEPSSTAERARKGLTENATELISRLENPTPNTRKMEVHSDD